jgi:hypothetical protein
MQRQRQRQRPEAAAEAKKPTEPKKKGGREPREAEVEAGAEAGAEAEAEAEVEAVPARARPGSMRKAFLNTSKQSSEHTQSISKTFITLKSSCGKIFHAPCLWYSAFTAEH